MTTPIYRAPEQIDMFRAIPITTKVDIWGLGCLMFTLMYHRPPFDDTSKLSQMNGTYKLPKYPSYSSACIGLVQKMLRVNPDERPTAQKIYEETLEMSGNQDTGHMF